MTFAKINNIFFIILIAWRKRSILVLFVKFVGFSLPHGLENVKLNSHNIQELASHI